VKIPPLTAAVGRTTFGLLLALCLTACAPRVTLQPETISTLPVAAHVADVPFFPQEQFQCGPASLAAMYQFTGLPIDPETLRPQIYLPGKQGSLQAEIIANVRRQQRLALPVQASLDGLLQELAAHRPVLVLQNLGFDWRPVWHYAVATGYDLSTQTITLNTGVTAQYAMDLAMFDRSWQRAKRWAIVVTRIGDIGATTPAQSYFQALAALEKTTAPQTLLPGYLAGQQRWPQHFVFAFAAGNAYYQQQNWADAARWYRLALQAGDADQPVVLNNLADTLSQQGQYSQALHTLDQIQTTDPAMQQTLTQTRREILHAQALKDASPACAKP